MKRTINQRLEKLPEYRRIFAENALNRVLQKYYDEPEEKLEPIVNVILDAIERDEYYFIIDRINNAKKEDIESFAKALQESSFIEMAMMQQQVNFRLEVINEIEEIIKDPKALEIHAHKALENRLWILGSEYSLKSSNTSLKRISEEYLSQQYSGKNASKRPDLLLLNDQLGKHTLIEFKRPNHKLIYEDYSQAIAYRNELLKTLQELEVIVIVGERDNAVTSAYTEKDVRFMTFSGILSNARAQYQWLLAQLSTP